MVTGTGLEIENEMVPTGIKGSKVTLNIGQSRMRARYWRLVGDTWTQTGLLPADPTSVAIYFAKGFKGKPPTESVPVTGIKCPLCEFSCEAPRGLAKHMYSHDKKEKEETNELS